MTTDQARRRTDPILLIPRVAGALLLLGIGGDHLDLWITGYRHIPTIGPLFLLQVVASILLGVAVAVLDRWYVAAAGALFAVGTLAGYELFRLTTIFGFHEVRTTAGFTAGVLEVAAFVALGGYALLAYQRAATAGTTVDAGGPTKGPTERLMAVSASRLGTVGALVAVVLIALVGISAVPGHTSPSRAGAANAGITIVIKNFTFSPADPTVAPGEVVKVVNEDSVAHTITSLTGKFDTGDITPGGGSADFTAPSAPGTYKYDCSIHTFMTGSITVR